MIFRSIFFLILYSQCACTSEEAQEKEEKEQTLEERNAAWQQKSQNWLIEKNKREKENVQFNQGVVNATKPELQVDMEKFKVVQQNAVKGDPDYQYSLGMCYKYGYGVKADYNKALYWFKKAADQGHKQAERVYLFMVRRK